MAEEVIVYSPYEKVDLSVFTDVLEYEFTKLDLGAAERFILDTAIYMAQYGNVLRRKATIHTQACVENYLLEPPDCMQVNAIMSICAKCSCCSCGPIRLTSSRCHCTCGCGSCNTYTWYDKPNEIYFSPAHHNSIYEIEMAVVPIYDTCEIDKVYRTELYSTLMLGVKAKILSISGKPWSSQNQADSYQLKFERALRRDTIHALLGGQRGLMHKKMPCILGR